jgi:CubicO group peptidase (beta-lactamase class C family)/beta-glucosidase-like glycosyl hydrolase
MAKKIIWIILFIISAFSILFFSLKYKQKKSERAYKNFYNVDMSWADTTIKYLSSEEKIGQLLMYKIGNVNDSLTFNTINNNLNQTMPGGIIYSTDSLTQFIKFQNNLQKNSKINPLIATDTTFAFPEFKDGLNFPKFLALLAVKNDTLISDLFKNAAIFYNSLNVQLNFMPVLKRTDNITNIKHINIINSILAVYEKNKIISLTPHTTEFFKPDEKLFSPKIKAIVFEKQKAADIPNYIKNKQFNGLFIQNTSRNEMHKDSVLQFFKNGTDMFITQNPNELKTVLSQLLNEELITEDEINKKVSKILAAKTYTGLNKTKHLNTDSIMPLFKSSKMTLPMKKIFKQSITLIKNDKNLVPITDINSKKFEFIEVGKEKLTKFKDFISEYKSVKYNYVTTADECVRHIETIKNETELIIVLNEISVDSVFINTVFSKAGNKSVSFINFGNPENVTDERIQTLIYAYGVTLAEQKYTADALFGGIQIQGQFPFQTGFKNYKSLSTKKIRVAASTPEEEGLSSIILSKIDSIANDGIKRGAYPGCQVVVFKNGNSVYNKAFGYHTYAKQNNVKPSDLYDLASITKIAATTLAAMKLYDQGRIHLDDKLAKFFKNTEIDYSGIKPDTIINIDTMLFSEVIDYKKILKYQDTIHLSDTSFLAYDTLIVTSTPANNIFKVKIRDLLLHQSGISPTLPILPYVLYKKNFYDSIDVIKKRYLNALLSDSIKKKKNPEFNAKKELLKIYKRYYSNHYIKDSSEIKIAENMFFRKNYMDTLWKKTKQLRVYSRKIYQYSDINMILLQIAIDSLNRQSIDKYVKNQFYLPMGLKTMCFKPANYFSKSSITPTENEQYWREQTLRGDVHDPSAAMLGRVAGNAGLFSNAYDLAVLAQMWLNGGTYGGRRYISESTVKLFTGFQEESHRGLGFDKPSKQSIIGNGAPKESYGHTGFTGTCVWVDPINEIVFVFLSNRVHPNQKNWMINKLKIRQKIHSVVYEAICKAS